MDSETYFYNILNEKQDVLSIESHFLTPLNSSNDRNIYLSCGMCKHKTITAIDFWCNKCYVTYHKECVESPPQIKVPYHPKHPLQLLLLPRFNTINIQGSNHYNKCNCCGEDIESFYYSCSICDFNFHHVCAIRLNVLSIHNPKKHDHTLTYFPRKNSLTCDICALGDAKSFIYVCYQCDFVVHKSCIYLPTTIRISRHDHRLSFTMNHPTTKQSCGVCRKKIEENYGGYSCVKGCIYVVHPKCAIRRDLWDGEELEGEPEIIYEDIKTFIEISDGIIEHFSHSIHHMRLEHKEKDRVDNRERCEACLLPINDGNIYNCMKCNFMLHKTCAHLPSRKWHQLHAHPLTLQVYLGKFECKACRNDCCGFAYTCCETSCSFSLDVRCASVSEPFVHELHPHPLFLPSEEGRLRTCSICGGQKEHLNCLECSFVLCFRCATLPYRLKYRHDEHYLIFSYKEDAMGYSWCEICEKEIHSQSHGGFYTCNMCSNTVHIECLLGNDPFIRHGLSIMFHKVMLLIIPNDRLTRPICGMCERHSPCGIAFVTLFGVIFCSMECVNDFGKERLFELEQQWRKEVSENMVCAVLMSFIERKRDFSTYRGRL